MTIWKSWDDYVEQEPIKLEDIERWFREDMAYQPTVYVLPPNHWLGNPARWLRLSWGQL